MKKTSLYILLFIIALPAVAQQKIRWGIDNTTFYIYTVKGEYIHETSIIKPAVFVSANKNTFYLGPILYQNNHTLASRTNYSFFTTYERTLLSYKDRFWLYSSATLALTNGKILYDRGMAATDSFCYPCYYTSNRLGAGIAFGARIRFLKRLRFTLGGGWGANFYFNREFSQQMNKMEGILINLGLGYFFRTKQMKEANKE